MNNVLTIQEAEEILEEIVDIIASHEGELSGLRNIAIRLRDKIGDAKDKNNLENP